MANKNFKAAANDYLNNPTMNFISSTTDQSKEELQEQTAQAKNQHYKIDYTYTPKRDKRVQVLLTQILYEQIKATSESESISVNEFINRAIESYLKENK